MALLVTPGLESGVPRLLTWCRRAWPPTIVVCLLFYGAALHWLGPGLPGVSYPQNMHLIGWRDFGRDFEVAGAAVHARNGPGNTGGRHGPKQDCQRACLLPDPIPRCRGGATGHDPAFQTASEHLFGSVGLMYALWFPANQQNGKTMLLVGKDASSLSTDRVLSRVKTAGAIGEIGVRNMASRPAAIPIVWSPAIRPAGLPAA